MSDEASSQQSGRIFYKSKDAEEFAQKLKEDLVAVYAPYREEDQAWRAEMASTQRSMSLALDQLVHSVSNLPNAIAAVLRGPAQGQFAQPPPPPPDLYRQPSPANPIFTPPPRNMGGTSREPSPPNQPHQPRQQSPYEHQDARRQGSRLTPFPEHLGNESQPYRPTPLREYTPAYQPEPAMTAPTGRTIGDKPTKYSGSYKENLEQWLHLLEIYFANNGVPPERKSGIFVTFLTGEALSFYFHLLRLSESDSLEWPALRQAYKERFESSLPRIQYLRQALDRVRYKGIDRMFEYCQTFRDVEVQIFNMTFIERLERFTRPLPSDCIMHIYNGIPELFKKENMEIAYQAARLWSTNHLIANQRHDRHRSTNSAHSKKKVKFTPMLTIPGLPKERDKEKERDKDREEDELDMMDVSKAKCYNCERIGHLAVNCNQPKKPRVSRQGGFGKKAARPSRTLYALEIEGESSEEEEEEEPPDSYYHDGEYIDIDDLPTVDYEYLNLMPYCFDDSTEFNDVDEPDGESEWDGYTGVLSEYGEDCLDLLSVYVDNATGMREAGHLTVRSAPLPLYSAEIEGWEGKAIIDSGASTQYIGQNAVSAIKGINVIDIPPRMIRIAGQGDEVAKVPVSKIATFDIKLGDLPTESIGAYVFPLDKPDIVLGMGWLEKHNPLPDWRMKTWEFTRNGRRYQLNPTRRIPTFKVEPAESNSVTDTPDDEHACIQLMESTVHPEVDNPQLVSEPELPKEGKVPRVRERLQHHKNTVLGWLREKCPNLSRERLQHHKNTVLGWLRENCPNLLRPVGIPAKLQPFTIDTGPNPPIKIPQRKYSPADQDKINEFVKENLENGVISESESPWSSPIVVAAKRDGSPRICLDYRALNAITVKDAYPIPQIDESFLHFAGAKYFTLLDMKSGYWQIPLDEQAKLKTAFSTRHGHYHWNVLPFGLTNGVAGYQRRINTVLARCLDLFVLVYIDDILIFSRTTKEHERHVKEVLRTLNDVGMVLNLDKCEFFVTEVKFLGHIISPNGIRPNPENIAKVLDWPAPRTITDVRGFNNLANHYSRYVKDFAELALPLTDLQRGSPPKGAPVEWTPECQGAFDRIKKALTSSPVLIHPDMTKPFILDPDASQFRIGAVLQQYSTDPDGKQRLHPVAYESKKLTPTEQRYSSQERELLAAKHSLNHWRHLLDGSQVTIRTDHESLKVYRTKRPMTRRLARFMDEIEHYDPTIIYRPGKLQVVPDALSRLAGRCEGPPADTDRFQGMEDGKDRESEEHRGNEDVGNGIVEQGNTEDGNPDHEPRRDSATSTPSHPRMFYDRVAAHLAKQAEIDDTDDDFKAACARYRLQKRGVLFNVETQRRVVMDAEKLKEIMESTHKDLGHYGARATAGAVRQRFEVANDLWEEGRKVLEGCVPCQLFKQVPDPASTATIHPFEAKDPFQMWGIDFVGPLVETTLGNKYLITAIDYCTGKAIAHPLEERSTAAAMDMMEEIVWTYGPPESIITDNGQEFNAFDFLALLKRYGIRRTPTSPGHPQTNGKVERLNHEIVQRLQRIAQEEGNDMKHWDLYLQRALFAYAAHTNSRTGMSPFKLQFGVEPKLPSAASLSSTPISHVEREMTAEERRHRIQDLSKYRSVATARYQEAIRRLAEDRDDAVFLRDPIQRGDLVMRSPINRQSKLHPKWEGPFVVLDISDTDAFQLASSNGHIVKNLVNKARLRKLDPEERAKYADEYWIASNRLRKHDELAKQQRQINELDIRARQATIEALERQKRGQPAPLTEFVEITRQRQELAAKRTAAQAELHVEAPPVPMGRPRRLRRLTPKALEASKAS